MTQRVHGLRWDWSSYPPDPQVVSAGGQQVRVRSFAVGNPHDLGGGVWVVESVSTYELWVLLLQTNYLNLWKQNNNSARVGPRSITEEEEQYSQCGSNNLISIIKLIWLIPVMQDLRKLKDKSSRLMIYETNFFKCMQLTNAIALVHVYTHDAILKWRHQNIIL